MHNAQSKHHNGSTLVNIPVPYSVKCFTEIRMPSDSGINSNVIFRASPGYRGSPWFDWALVQDPNFIQHRGHDEGCYIGQILGFFKYTTQSIVTPRYSHAKSNPIWDKTDDTLYCAIHACDQFVKVSDLDNNLIVPFNMENQNKAYMIPVADIIRPMVVVSN